MISEDLRFRTACSRLDDIGMSVTTIRLAAFLCVLAIAATVGFADRVSKFSKKSGTSSKTAGADRPEGTFVPGEHLVHSTGTINRNVLEAPMARVNGERSQIKVSETRAKDVKVFSTREITVIKTKTLLRASDEVSVPRMSKAEFQKILERYQKGMDQPIVTKRSSLKDVADPVSLDDINKYSDAADSVDDEGIPVVPAGGE